MHSKIDITSLSISKAKPDVSALLKYDVEATLDEIENNDESFTMRFSLVVLSELKLVRIGVDGIVCISGNSSERENILHNGEDGIPELVHLIYLKLFPEFFMLTKSINVPCPQYNISKTSKQIIEDVPIESPIEEPEITSYSLQNKNSVEDTFKQNNSDANLDPKISLDKERKLEEMQIDELLAHSTKLKNEYSKNPANDTLMTINKISKIISEKQKNNKIIETPKQ